MVVHVVVVSGRVLVSVMAHTFTVSPKVKGTSDFPYEEVRSSR